LTCIKARRRNAGTITRVISESEDAMATAHARLSISGLGFGFSAALVVLFVLCMLSALFLPMRLAHGWVGLFSDAPVGSTRIWLDGLIWSVAVGWLIALVFGTVYNFTAARRTLALLRG
jgi:hypothetical protein